MNAGPPVRREGPRRLVLGGRPQGRLEGGVGLEGARARRSSPLLIAQAWTPTEFDWRVATLGGKPLFIGKYRMASGHWQILAASRPGPGSATGRGRPAPTGAPRRGPPGLPGRRPDRRRALRRGHQGHAAGTGRDRGERQPQHRLGLRRRAEGDRVYREVIRHFVREVNRQPGKPAPTRLPRVRRRTSDPELAALRSPIGRAPAPPERPYRAYEVCGLELEYVVVDRDLNVMPKVEPFLAMLRGRPASDAVSRGGLLQRDLEPRARGEDGPAAPEPLRDGGLPLGLKYSCMRLSESSA